MACRMSGDAWTRWEHKTPESDKSVYTTYARMQVVHRRTVPATGFEVAWLSDKTGFVAIFI